MYTSYIRTLTKPRRKYIYIYKSKKKKQQDLGLESPNYFGYWDYDDMVVAMDTYVTGIEDTSGEVVVKVPPKPTPGEVPRGLEDVATYLYQARAINYVCTNFLLAVHQL